MPTTSPSQRNASLSFLALLNRRQNESHVTETNQNERQKITSQKKRQYQAPEKQLKEGEVGKVPGREFRIMMMQMIQGLGKRMEKIQENFTTELEVVQNVNNLLAMRDPWVRKIP